MRPASISPWQLAHTKTHFCISARYAASDLPLPICMGNDFVDGSKGLDDLDDADAHVSLARPQHP